MGGTLSITDYLTHLGQIILPMPEHISGQPSKIQGAPYILSHL
jgi:hypothetical protein